MMLASRKMQNHVGFVSIYGFVILVVVIFMTVNSKGYCENRMSPAHLSDEHTATAQYPQTDDEQTCTEQVAKKNNIDMQAFRTTTHRLKVNRTIGSVFLSVGALGALVSFFTAGSIQGYVNPAPLVGLGVGSLVAIVGAVFFAIATKRLREHRKILCSTCLCLEELAMGNPPVPSTGLPIM